MNKTILFGSTQPFSGGKVFSKENSTTKRFSQNDFSSKNSSSFIIQFAKQQVAPQTKAAYFLGTFLPQNLGWIV
jgi:hypothetical protein